MKLILQSLTVLEHVLLIALHDSRLPEIGEVGLDVGLEITGGLPADVGPLNPDLLGEPKKECGTAADIGEIGVPEIHFDVGESVLHVVEGLHHERLGRSDPVIHLIKFEELAKKEEVLVPKNSPVWG